MRGCGPRKLAYRRISNQTAHNHASMRPRPAREKYIMTRKLTPQGYRATARALRLAADKIEARRALDVIAERNLAGAFALEAPS